VSRFNQTPKLLWMKAQALDADEQRVFGYLYLSPHRVIEGIFHLPLGYAGVDLNMAATEVDRHLRSLADAQLLDWDPQASVVLLPDGVPSGKRSPNQTSGAIEGLRELPRTQLFATYLEVLGEGCPDLVDAITKASPPLDQPIPMGPHAQPEPMPMGSSRVAASAGNPSGRDPGTATNPSPGVARASAPTRAGVRGRAEAEAEAEAGKTRVEPVRLDEARSRIKDERIQRVFEEWRAATGRTDSTLLDDKRRSVIVKALKLKPEDEVIDAVRGVRHSEHHMSNRQYSELKVILRDAGQIEHFRDLQRGTGRRPQESVADFAARINARSSA
jgi:hypothetical protein